MAKNTVIHTSANYRVEIGAIAMVEEPLLGKEGYRLRNLRTNLVEREGFNEAEAIRAMHSAEQFLQDVLADPKGAAMQDSMPELDFDDLDFQLQ